MTQYRIFGSFLRPVSSCDPCNAVPTQSSLVTYDGANLPCTGVQTCDTLTVALQKIDQQVCELRIEMYDLTILVRNLSTTTTTTTTLPL